MYIRVVHACSVVECSWGHKFKRDEPYHNMCGQFYLYFSNILTHGRAFVFLEVHTPTWGSNVATSTHLKLVSIPL